MKKNCSCLLRIQVVKWNAWIQKNENTRNSSDWGIDRVSMWDVKLWTNACSPWGLQATFLSCTTPPTLHWHGGGITEGLRRYPQPVSPGKAAALDLGASWVLPSPSLPLSSVLLRDKRPSMELDLEAGAGKVTSPLDSSLSVSSNTSHGRWRPVPASSFLSIAPPILCAPEPWVWARTFASLPTCSLWSQAYTFYRLRLTFNLV